MTFEELMALDKATGSKPAQAPTSKSKVRAASTEKRAPKIPVRSDAVVPRRGDAKVPRHHGMVTRSLVRKLRKAVKQPGKEAATHRFTREEKDKLADIVYTYGRQGYRTSQNEVVRIATNWLVEDYRESGKHSVLHRVMKALKE